MHIGDEIRFLRNQCRLSQEKLAHALNVSRSTVSKWETGKQLPDIDTLKKLNRLFGVSLDHLIGTNDEKMLLEKKNQYHIEETSEQMLAVVRYLERNEKMVEHLYALQQLPANKRKHIETVVFTTIAELIKALK